MDKWLDLIRGIVRPVLTFAVIGVLLSLTFTFALRFADREVAMAVVMFITGSGATILGYWFGERKAQK